MEEICKGCRGSCGANSSLRLAKNGDVTICPCVSCIIKVVCTKGCDEFSKYVDGKPI